MGAGRGARFRVPATLTVHALERQEPSALLLLYILLEGEGQPLQPRDDLLHPPCPAGAAERPSGLQGGPYYIAPRRPLKGQALWRPHHHPRRAAPRRCFPLLPHAEAQSLGPHTPAGEHKTCSRCAGLGRDERGPPHCSSAGSQTRRRPQICVQVCAVFTFVCVFCGPSTGS